MNKTNCFAEVIESCLDHYTAHCWQWNHYPTFGSLVQVADKSVTTFGIVTHIQTGSIDPTRTPFPYQKTEEELLAEQPQIFEFLKTTFTVQVVGYQTPDNPKVFYLIPPTPCQIHRFVAPCNQDRVRTFFSTPDYLHLLFAFSSNIPNLDELLLALIKHSLDKKLLEHDNLDTFCQTFTLLTGNDYRRLKSFLKRVEHMI